MHGVREGGARGAIAPPTVQVVGAAPLHFVQLTPVNKNTAWVSQKASECTSEHLKSQNFLGKLPHPRLLLERTKTERVG